MQANSISNSFDSAIATDSVLTAGVPATGHAPFSGMLKNAITGVQNLEDQAANTVEGLMTGQGVDVHQAMIATEKADLSFEMALAVRGKAVAAYQQIMQMQF